LERFFKPEFLAISWEKSKIFYPLQKLGGFCSMGQVSQEQLYDMLVSRELGWQAIIYDLIKTEQLNPWDIDLVLLSRKYVERVQQLQDLEEGAFFISSKVLLAAAILLRIKSEILHSNIRDLDELLFDRKKKQRDEIVDANALVDFASEFEQDQNYIVPRTPLPRSRKITLQELMTALDRAINTEHRRIKKIIRVQRLRSNLDFVLPKPGISIRQKIKELYQKIKSFFSMKRGEKLTFTQVAGTERNERISCFLPLLHLDNQGKINLEQAEPFSEIEIWLKELKFPLKEDKTGDNQ
jgi:segregation and condensation protein A